MRGLVILWVEVEDGVGILGPAGVNSRSSRLRLAPFDFRVLLRELQSPHQR